MCLEYPGASSARWAGPLDAWRGAAPSVGARWTDRGRRRLRGGDSVPGRAWDVLSRHAGEHTGRTLARLTVGAGEQHREREGRRRALAPSSESRPRRFVRHRATRSTLSRGPSRVLTVSACPDHSPSSFKQRSPASRSQDRAVAIGLERLELRGFANSAAVTQALLLSLFLPLALARSASCSAPLCSADSRPASQLVASSLSPLPHSPHLHSLPTRLRRTTPANHCAKQLQSRLRAIRHPRSWPAKRSSPTTRPSHSPASRPTRHPRAPAASSSGCGPTDATKRQATPPTNSSTPKGSRSCAPSSPTPLVTASASCSASRPVMSRRACSPPPLSSAACLLTLTVLPAPAAQPDLGLEADGPRLAGQH